MPDFGCAQVLSSSAVSGSGRSVDYLRHRSQVQTGTLLSNVEAVGALTRRFIELLRRSTQDALLMNHTRLIHFRTSCPQPALSRCLRPRSPKSPWRIPGAA